MPFLKKVFQRKLSVTVKLGTKIFGTKIFEYKTAREIRFFQQQLTEIKIVLFIY
jgi:hypothetical protein